MSNPYDVVRQFEQTIADYAGAEFGVAVESCTAAIFLSLLWHKERLKMLPQPWVGPVSLPKHTYPGVPCSVINAGGTVVWRDEDWKGVYQLGGTPIIDGALRFRRDMYEPDTFHCLSFHGKKHLPIGRGGMILTNDPDAVRWLKKARFDGRAEVPLAADNFDVIGWNMYMTPEQAARGLELFNFIKQKRLPDLPTIYPDLSQFPVYGRL